MIAHGDDWFLMTQPPLIDIDHDAMRHMYHSQPGGNQVMADLLFHSLLISKLENACFRHKKQL